MARTRPRETALTGECVEESSGDVFREAKSSLSTGLSALLRTLSSPSWFVAMHMPLIALMCSVGGTTGIVFLAYVRRLEKQRCDDCNAAAGGHIRKTARSVSSEGAYAVKCTAGHIWVQSPPKMRKSCLFFHRVAPRQIDEANRGRTCQRRLWRMKANGTKAGFDIFGSMRLASVHFRSGRGGLSQTIEDVWLPRRRASHHRKTNTTRCRRAAAKPNRQWKIIPRPPATEDTFSHF